VGGLPEMRPPRRPERRTLGSGSMAPASLRPICGGCSRVRRLWAEHRGSQVGTSPSLTSSICSSMGSPISPRSAVASGNRPVGAARYNGSRSGWSLASPVGHSPAASADQAPLSAPRHVALAVARVMMVPIQEYSRGRRLRTNTKRHWDWWFQVSGIGSSAWSMGNPTSAPHSTSCLQR
jgi:hypothetical protein